MKQTGGSRCTKLNPQLSLENPLPLFLWIQPLIRSAPSLPPSLLTSSQYSSGLPLHLSHTSYSPSWSVSLLISFNNPDTEVKMSWTYATLLALLAVLLALSCESGILLKGNRVLIGFFFCLVVFHGEVSMGA